MRRSSCWIALVIATACANASDPAPGPTKVAEEAPASVAPEPAPGPTKVDEGAPPSGAAASSCEDARARYLALREGQNRCERDEDCAEIYPGVCSYGPHYADVAADHPALEAAARALTKACVLPACEMPLPLGIARCEAGRCEAGREAPRSGAKPCWDTRITYMEPGVPEIVSTHEHLRGSSPLHAVGVPSAGTLRISAQLGCTGCALMVSERNPGMASLVKGTPFTPAPDDPRAVRPLPSRSPPPMAEAVHLEYPVTPGSYFIAIVGGAPDEAQLEVSLRDASGRAMAPDRHGVVHLRTCEH